MLATPASLLAIAGDDVAQQHVSDVPLRRALRTLCGDPGGGSRVW